MGQVSDLLKDIEIPKFYKVRQDVPHERVADPSRAMREALRRPGTLDRITPGARVAITGSSREMADIVPMMRSLGAVLRERGAIPFVVPAMGSHGGASAEGQKRLLEGYGVYEENIGMPVVSSMATREVGKSADGLSVHVDETALRADFIIPFGRIKAHTDFRGKYESGLLKMMVIGLGKQHGASICHSEGFHRMAHHVLAFAKVILANCKIPFGIGVVENAFHEVYSINAIPKELILDEEPALLRTAKSIMPEIPFEKIDILICEESGKDISGNGMDSNVIGRSYPLGRSKPFIERIGVLRLSKKTGGSFAGIGHADFTTRKILEQGDLDESYPNIITSHLPEPCFIPPMMDSDRVCLQACIGTCIEKGPDGFRIAWIHNTLSLENFYISEGLLSTARENPALVIGDEPLDAEFDGDGEFVGFAAAKV